VLIHTTSAWPEKSWSAQAWAHTLAELAGQAMGPFVLTGGNAAWEREYVADIERACSAPLINLCGKTGLQAYLAVVANADMLLGIDGSSAHLANAFGVPTLTLFGPSNPKTWHYSSETSIALDAREFTDATPPPVAAIPAEAVVQKAKMLNRV
jgi:ADP-heptose:LPS heptosyltransferase